MTIVSKKARLVVSGYLQIKGINYFDTTNMMVVFILLFIACINQYEISTFDASAAFLEGTYDVIQYAWIPEELCSNNKSTRVKAIGNGIVRNKALISGTINSISYQILGPCF